MNQIDRYALVLFKDHTMLELKAFLAKFLDERKGKAGGAMEPFETQVLNTAIEYHRIYMGHKLNESKIEKDGLF